MHRLSRTRGVTANAGRLPARQLSSSSPFSSASLPATSTPPNVRMASSRTAVVAARRLAATVQHIRPMSSSSAAAPALDSTSTSYPTTHAKIASPRDTPYFLDNEFRTSATDKFIPLHDPATNNVVTRVPQMTDSELRAAVDSAQRAFPAWRATSVLARQQIMFRFVALIRENWDRLAASITLEQGKTFADAKGDVLRGLQVAEAACGAPELLKGELLEVAKDMETRTYREPLGVVAAICPFSEFLRTTQTFQ